MHTNKSILCTAEVGNEAVKKAAEQGVALEVLPFIDVVYVEDPETQKQVNELADKEIHVVFTSRNAVTSVAQMLGGRRVGWRVYCLGNKTKNAVIQLLGLSCECVMESSGQLAKNIIDAGVKHVTFFCTNIRMDTLPDALGAAGIVLNEVVVYKTVETPHRVDKVYDGILFFSPSGVRSFFKANKIDEQTTLFAIGHTTAAQVKEYTNAGVIVSPVQSKEGVIETVINFFKEKNK